MASSTPQSQASMLATITTDLDKIAPRFEIQPEQITIIKTPTDFYETLKVGSSLVACSLSTLVTVAVVIFNLPSPTCFSFQLHHDVYLSFGSIL
jgi:hypothetical protein